jgi:hypothetical protein
MGDLIKRGVFLAALGFAAWRAYQYWQGRDAVHQVVFKVEGPTSCQVPITYGTESAPQNERTTLAWESAPVATRGNAGLTLSVSIPLSCGWQPEQVTCVIERDGNPWKSAVGRRITDSANGDLASLRCEISARVTE